MLIGTNTYSTRSSQARLRVLPGVGMEGDQIFRLEDFEFSPTLHIRTLEGAGFVLEDVIERILHPRSRVLKLKSVHCLEAV